ncbi:MAG TPA: DsbA family protein, partial [Candidatus Manganitrophaceae bacterium]
CVAVKAVGLQGADLEDRYLRRVREAILTEKRPADRPADLLSLASELPGIDLDRLAREIDGEAAKKAFQEDWEATRRPVPEAKDTKVTEGRLRYSFPTLILSNDFREMVSGVNGNHAEGRYRVLDGDDPYEAYLKAIQELDPTIRRYPPPDVESFIRKYRRAAVQEASVVCDLSWEAAEAALERSVKEGRLRKRRAGHFYLYELMEPV